MKRNLIWKAFFSQSGSEINEISNRVGRFPDVIITNKSFEEMDKINPDLLEKCFNRFLFLPKKPTIQEYKEAIRYTDIITLHGYLRILPPEICSRFRIYNGHPGLITKFPELKGKDPQAKVWYKHFETPYKIHGHVIHEVIPEVDAGKVVAEKEIFIDNIYSKFNSLGDYINCLHGLAIDNWVAFMKGRVLNNKL
jgi:methionyl-tRNA formyltransferase